MFVILCILNTVQSKVSNRFALETYTSSKILSLIVKTRGSTEPVSLIWLCMHCLGSSKFVVSEILLLIHIHWVANLDFQSTLKKTPSRGPSCGYACTVWVHLNTMISDKKNICLPIMFYAKILFCSSRILDFQLTQKTDIWLSKSKEHYRQLCFQIVQYPIRNFNGPW